MDRLISENLLLRLFDGKVEQELPLFSKTMTKIIKGLPSAEPCEDVLDKIRAEIEQIEEGISSYHNDRPWIFKDEVLQIIDKYKAERSEE